MPQTTMPMQASTQLPTRAVAIPATAETGMAPSVTLATGYRRSSGGTRAEARTPPTPHTAKTRPNRHPEVPMCSTWSAHGTNSATNPAPATDWSIPTTVWERTPSSCHRKRTPSRTSRSTTAGRNGCGCSRVDDNARRIERTSRAEPRKVSASTASSVEGCTTASASPTPAGTTRSRTPPTPQIAALASPTRSRPTRTGRAPKLAPSKNVKRHCATNPATSTWGTVRTPRKWATGTEPMTTTLTRSAATMTR